MNRATFLRAAAIAALGWSPWGNACSGDDGDSDRVVDAGGSAGAAAGRGGSSARAGGGGDAGAGGSAGRAGGGGRGGAGGGGGRGGESGSAGAGSGAGGGGAGGAGGGPVATCMDGSPPPCATTGGSGELCAEVGWCEITDTTLEAVCATDDGFPEVHGVEGCAGIINDWSGGIADTARDRLIVWGGGHNGYYGNELYALDLASLQFVRLTDPSPPTDDGSECPEELEDGNPNSRHTYNGLAEIPHLGRMWAFGGSMACGPGNFGDDTWVLDLAALTWTRRDPASGPNPGPRPGVAADYDPNSQRVYLHDTGAFFSWDPETNLYEQLSEDTIDYHLTGVVDPERELFVMFGGDQVRVFDLGAGSDYAMQVWDDQVSGCEGIRDTVYPGLAYDPVQDRIVGWAGGDTAYVFDVDAMSCTAVTHPGGPGPQPDAGTHGRFRYFAEYDVFAVVNDWQQNAYTLRLRP
jgi:hypothetical protein